MAEGVKAMNRIEQWFNNVCAFAGDLGADPGHDATIDTEGESNADCDTQEEIT